MAGRSWDLVETQGVYKSDQAEPKGQKGLVIRAGAGRAEVRESIESRKPTRDWSKVGRAHLFFIHYFILFYLILSSLYSDPNGIFFRRRILLPHFAPQLEHCEHFAVVLHSLPAALRRL